MARGWMKGAVCLVILVILFGVLAVLVMNARARGKLSYCRNNLRRLGGMVNAERVNFSEDPPTERGRVFWQYLREENYRRPSGEWFTKGGLNPFGCPVLGRAPLDLAALSREELATHMSDPATIDYRGPQAFPQPFVGRILLGCDREQNHPRGGLVLWTDLSVSEREAKSLLVVPEGYEQAVRETVE